MSAWVYRVYDADRNLLYVGHTCQDPFIRMFHHHSREALEQAGMAYVEGDLFESRDEAILHEGVLIDEERPRFNKQRSAVELRKALVAFMDAQEAS